jgi:hypothetical protein
MSLNTWPAYIKGCINVTSELTCIENRTQYTYKLKSYQGITLSELLLVGEEVTD